MKVWTCKANNRGVWQKSFETLISQSINAAGAWVVGAKSNAWTGHFDWNHSSSCLRGFRRNKESSTANGVAKTRCQGQRSHSALDFQPVWVSRPTKLERTLAKAAKKAWWNPTRWGGWILYCYCCFLWMLVCFIAIYCHRIFFNIGEELQTP